MIKRINNIYNNYILFSSPIKQYIISFSAIVITSLFCFPFKEAIGYQTVGLIFLMTVALLSLLIGRGPVLFAALLNFIIWNYFFIPPLFTFHVYNLHDIITLFANLIIAVVTGVFITRIRNNQNQIKKSQESISILNSLLESLNNANSIKDVVKKAREELIKHFDSDAVIILKEKENMELSKKIFGNTTLLNEDEFVNAKKSFDEQKPVVSRLHFFPLTTNHGVIGVIGIGGNLDIFSDPDKMALLKSVTSQITSALVREINIDIAKEKQIYLESQKLFQTVLNSVSHELRTPVAIIAAAVSNLSNEITSANKEARDQICSELNLSASRLNVLIENILDMSKIESGYLTLNYQYTDIGDLTGIVLNELKSEITEHKININIEENLPLVMIDVNWLRQAIINVIHNSLIYSPKNSEINIRAFLDDSKFVNIELSDQGSGVPESSLQHLFEKFYRVQGSKTGGIGLGLTITKAIVEAHNGEISANNGKNGGLVIKIRLKTV